MAPATAPRILGVIPARLASQRLPGKALLAETGRPLVIHVLEQASRAVHLDAVVVAAPDEAILEAVRRHGGTAVATSFEHPNGTSRIGEVLARPEFASVEIAVNIQGDEPLIDPAAIDRAVGLLIDRPEVEIATLACPFGPDEDPRDPAVVKVVCGSDGMALYFSRACIPHQREPGDPPPPRLRHVGLYAYRREALRRLASLPERPLERSERLEQLRALEHGLRIAVAEVDRAEGGIDTPEQYAAFVARMRAAAPR
jgi:3-deoxy-manno-octulosonate cytidylyltransferase (CMP-KDO synthetase)